MKKRLHFSAETQFSIKLSSAHVKCTFDNWDDNFKWKKNFLKCRNWWKNCIKFENNYQILLWRRKSQFCQKCRIKVVRSQKVMRSKPQNVEKSHVPPRNLFCFHKNSLYNWNADLTAVPNNSKHFPTQFFA